MCASVDLHSAIKDKEISEIIHLTLAHGQRVETSGQVSADLTISFVLRQPLTTRKIVLPFRVPQVGHYHLQSKNCKQFSTVSDLPQSPAHVRFRPVTSKKNQEFGPVNSSMFDNLRTHSHFWGSKA